MYLCDVHEIPINSFCAANADTAPKLLVCNNYDNVPALPANVASPATLLAKVNKQDDENDEVEGGEDGIDDQGESSDDGECEVLDAVRNKFVRHRG